jgi:glycine cleavage system transcriptional repressor
MHEPRHLVLSALAADRPGLVAEVSEFVTARGGNIEDSRMVVLGGEFGVLVLVSGDEKTIARIEQDAPELRRTMDVMVRRTKSPEEHRRAAVVPYLVTAESLDREGIVRAVSGVLGRMGINIVSLETTSFSAPFTGSDLFRLEARIDVPRSVRVADVRRALDEVGRAENLDIDVRSLVQGG